MSSVVLLLMGWSCHDLIMKEVWTTMHIQQRQTIKGWFTTNNTSMNNFGAFNLSLSMPDLSALHSKDPVQPLWITSWYVFLQFGIWSKLIHNVYVFCWFKTTIQKQHIYCFYIILAEFVLTKSWHFSPHVYYQFIWTMQTGINNLVCQLGTWKLYFC